MSQGESKSEEERARVSRLIKLAVVCNRIVAGVKIISKIEAVKSRKR